MSVSKRGNPTNFQFMTDMGLSLPHQNKNVLCLYEWKGFSTVLTKQSDFKLSQIN